MPFWTPTFFIIVVILVLLYAIFSIYLRKISGLYIAAGFHIILGLFSLPSIGWYVISLGIIEIIIGIFMINKQRQNE